jgi:hypothetical protein
MSKWYEVEVQVIKTFAIEFSEKDDYSIISDVLKKELGGDGTNISIVKHSPQDVEALINRTDPERVLGLA